MLLALVLGFFSKLFSSYEQLSYIDSRNGTGPQDWNFVEVRPGAHMFYWLYYTSADVKHYTQKPLVIWLHGGPGGSSTGSGNFDYFGPIDIHGNKRNNSWVEHVNMIFIDSPVGAGFSYVEFEDRYTTNTTQIARDLVTCMKQFYTKHPEFVKVPLHIFSESYGGKMAPEFGLELYRAVERGEVIANVKSITVGNPFISIVETHLAIPSFLLQRGRIDPNDYKHLRNIAFKMTDHLNTGNLTAAVVVSQEMMRHVANVLDGVDVYNIDNIAIPDHYYGFNPKLKQFMRGQVAKALNITSGYEWAAQWEHVFEYLLEDIAKSSVPIVEELLNTTPIKLAFYLGSLDGRCPTLGTVNIIHKMEWRSKPAYLAAIRRQIRIDGIVEGYERSDGRLSTFWIDRAGHMVQLDNPKVMSYILQSVTNISMGR